MLKLSIIGYQYIRPMPDASIDLILNSSKS